MFYNIFNGGRKIPKRYIPDYLSEADKERQLKSILEKKPRPYLKSFKPRKSSWTMKAKKYFGENNTSLEDMSKILSKGDKIKEKILLKGLKKIFKKAEGAYFSSGSRPQQTPASWGFGRVFSVLFGGPSRKLDDKIVKKYEIPLLRVKN